MVKPAKTLKLHRLSLLIGWSSQNSQRSWYGLAFSHGLQLCHSHLNIFSFWLLNYALFSSIAPKTLFVLVSTFLALKLVFWPFPANWLILAWSHWKERFCCFLAKLCFYSILFFFFFICTEWRFSLSAANHADLAKSPSKERFCCFGAKLGSFRMMILRDPRS